MSQDTSRKRFLSKVLGFAAAGAVVPGSVAQAVVAASHNKADAKPAAFRLMPQSRAVARARG